MALVKKPVTGMKDILPEEMQIRDYVLNMIKETYREFRIHLRSTLPAWSTSKICCSKQGGETMKS